MPRDYSGSKTYKKPGKQGCKGCCRKSNSDNEHKDGWIELSSCGECNMKNHQDDCPRRRGS